MGVQKGSPRGAAVPAVLQGWYKSPGPWRHSPLTKTRPMTSQDLFKTGGSFLYRPDETHEYRRQGRCSHQHSEIAEQPLPSCCHREMLPFSALPVFQHEKQSTLSLPTTTTQEVANLLPTPAEKHTAVKRSPLSPCRGWNSSSSSSVLFVLMGTISNSLTIAKVEQQRARKRHQLPVSFPICALEHLPKTYLIIRVLLYQAQPCTGRVNDY